MDHWVEDHLQWRLMTAEDAGELTHLREQIEVFDDTMFSGVEQLGRTAWLASLEDDCVGGWDHYGSLVAYGWNVPDTDPKRARVTLAGGVHPTHRDLSIGRNLIAWQEARAMAWRDRHRPGLDLWLGSYVEDVQPGLRHLLRSTGFHEERHFFDMHRRLDDVPTPRSIDGIDFVPFELSRSDEVHNLHHLCFLADVPADQDHWDKSLPRIRPDWSWVALQGEEAVGYALSGIDDAAAMDGVVEGWTDRLGVHPAHRRRGIASGLLEHTMVSMAQSGCPGAGIGVDTQDPNLPRFLHGSLGYESRDAVVLMAKTIPVAESVS
ncbi:GNAT family N-acetyltransferase [Tessaracoccus antarcticus]|uniref:GNAT family N-acetyltransferase n=1 Tax=Tessaracoccus antarcticus TaxID=2479848 RepID=A0A3M0GB09_9ACTN|nr:GNAT family N-acetyltransferase [Tessaracoccus antarcticus]RMB58763.1 GNAT family N-acetyltransferase [Tessaracoccus antarcticus]